MAEFMVSATGGRGEVSRLGHKNGGVRATLRSWEGSLEAILEEDAQDGKVVKLLVDTGSTGRPQRMILRVRLSELVALSARGGRLEIPPAGRKMTHQQFAEEYEHNVEFVCDCGGEIIMGMCENWADTPDGAESVHYYYK